MNPVLLDLITLMNNVKREQETIRVFLSEYIEKDMVIVTDNNTEYLNHNTNDIKENYDKICFCGINAYNLLKEKFSEYVISELDDSIVVKYIVIKILRDYYEGRK